MPAYNVYLGDVNSGLSDEVKRAVQATLTGWFSRIVSGDATASVIWTSSAPASIRDNELLVYFVRSSMDSVVRALPGGGGRAGTGDGFTMWAGELTASEVYVSNSRHYLAEMAFHELMHNKLHLGDAALHARDGLARVPVMAGTGPSPQNIAQMRAALSVNRRQWTGGWTAANDPLLGL
jgi:hypothetical protein